MVSLRITSGQLSGQVVELEGELVIGREAADLEIPDPEASRRHVALRPAGEGVEIEDLGSLNGTFVDEKRIEGSVTVSTSCALRIGNTSFAVGIPVREPEPEPEPEPEQPSFEATREAQVVPAPDATVAREVVQPPEPVADPGVTAQRPIADPDATAQRPIADPDATAQRPIADPDATAQRPIPDAPIADPDATAQRPVADIDVTAKREVVAPPEEPTGLAGAGNVTIPIPVLGGIAAGVVILLLLIVILT